MMARASAEVTEPSLIRRRIRRIVQKLSLSVMQSTVAVANVAACAVMARLGSIDDVVVNTVIVKLADGCWQGS